MLFEIPGYGRVSEFNAAFTMSLKSLEPTGTREKGDKDYVRLSDIPVGSSAIATFQNGAGTTVVEIRRLM